MSQNTKLIVYRDFKWKILILVISAFVLIYLNFKEIISGDWINRIGIILNFLAGFMVAPDLIGIKRLQELEGKFEKRIVSLNINIIKKYEKIYGRFTFPILFPTVYWMLILISLILIKFNYHNIGAIIFFLSNFIFFGQFILLFLLTYVLDKFNLVSWWTFGTGNFLKEMTTANELFFDRILTTPYIKIKLILYLLLNYILATSIDRLTGEDKIKSILVWWGVIFFILGNLMQFIATFDSKTENIRPQRKSDKDTVVIIANNLDFVLLQ